MVRATDGGNQKSRPSGRLRHGNGLVSVPRVVGRIGLAPRAGQLGKPWRRDREILIGSTGGCARRGSAMMDIPAGLFKRWGHSFEEDKADVQVYRPAGYNFP